MTQKIYVVEGRQFRTDTDYSRARHDKEIIDKLRERALGYDAKQLEQLKSDVHNGKYNFLTILGQDFEDELEELIKKRMAGSSGRGKSRGSTKRRQESTGKIVQGSTGTKRNAGMKKVSSKKAAEETGELDEVVKEELKRQEKRRKQLSFLCGVMAVLCLGYFGLYTYYDHKTTSSYETLNELKEKPPVVQSTQETVVQYAKTEEKEPEKPKEVLDEYKNLINLNKKLIGWVKIDDTNIDYPVMQTSDNEYYLDHNLNQEYDKNGSIFMDKDCDVQKPSTNYILYGHHMKSGKMFGDLDKYSKQEYYEKHPYIKFDTIYEKGTYQIMYVFRSRVYSEEEIVFKYYQFIDALSEQEFNSNMQEMAALSLYDTGVTAQYGDQLLTLSTCDYQEKNGRFVVVAKKIAKE